YVVGGFAGGGFDFGGGVVTTGAIQNAFLAKYGPTGTLSWVHTYNATGVSYGGALGLDASGALYIAGVYGPSTKLDLGNGALPPFTATDESAVFLGRLAP